MFSNRLHSYQYLLIANVLLVIKLKFNCPFFAVCQASQQVISLHLTFYMVYHPFSEGSQKRFNKRYKSNITFSVRALHPSLHFIKLFLKAQILHFSCSLQLLKAGEIFQILFSIML